MSVLDVRWFFLGLALFFFPFSGLYISVPVLKPYVLFGAIYMAMALLSLWDKALIYLKLPFVCAAFFFFFYVCLSYFWSEDKSATLMALIKITFVLGLSCVWAIDIRESNKRLLSFVILVVSALAVTVFGFWKCYLFGFDKIAAMFMSGAVHSGSKDFTAFIEYIFVSYPIAQYHHGVAIYVVFCLALILLLLGEKVTRLERFLVVLMSFAAISVVFITLSKTAIIAYVFLMSALWFKKRRVLWVNVFLCFSVLLANPLYVRDAVFERFSIVSAVYENATQKVVNVPAKQTHTPDAGVSERVKLWGEAIGLFRDSPWFGHGYRALGDKYDAISIDDAKYPHNIILQVLSELGGVGCFLFLAMFFSLFVQIVRANIKDKFSCYGFVVMSLSATFVSLQLEEVYIWLGLFIIAMCTSNINSSGRQQGEFR